MKKLTTVLIAILFALSMTGLCFAQAPAKDAMSQPVQKPTAEEQKKMDEKRAEKKKQKAEKKKAKKAKKAEAKKKKAPREKGEPLPETMEKTPGQGGKQEVK